MSEMTVTELEHFAAHGRRTNERLACATKIERSGEVVIMTDQKKTETSKEPVKDKFQEEFEALPLEKKFAKLFKMEAVTLGETISYVMDSPFKVLSCAVTFASLCEKLSSSVYHKTSLPWLCT